jgi:hypothetical protein
VPALSNPRHERFAQELAKGNTADAAYVSAGYKENRHNAATLGRSKHISTRVSEIQDRAAVRTEITLAGLTERLIRLADKAEALADAPGIQASRACIADAAKLNGMVIDKAEVKQEVEVTDARERLAHKLAGIVAAADAARGAAKPH